MKIPKILLSFTISLLCFSKNILGTSPLDVTTTVSFLSSNKVFHKDNLYVHGFVKFNAGVTILNDGSAIFDIAYPFSGGLDLRETGTLILQGDLYLDSNFTLSRSGSISGNGKTIFLNEDLRIPDNSIIHIKSDTIINGQGNNLVFGRRGRIFVDTNITLTLRNMKIVQNHNDFSDPFIQLAAFKSNLALDNTELALSQDFLFPQGQLFIHGDVVVTGTSAFIYQSTQHSFITPDSTFYFDNGTTFSITPATITDCRFDQWPTYTSNNFITMSDQTSKIHFNESSLITTPTGCRFTKGAVNFENKCFIKSNSALTLPTTHIGNSINEITTEFSPSCVAWSHDGNFLAVVNKNSDSLQIFDSVTFSQIGSSVNTGNNPISVSWSNTSTQLAVVNSGNNTLDVFNFDGLNTPILSVSKSTGTTPSCCAWSTWGQFIAVTNSGSNTLQIFKSNTLSQIGSNVSTDNQPSSVSWAPGDKYLAVTNTSANTLQIFSFDYASTPIQIGSSAATGFSPSSVSWANTGVFIAIANKSSNTLQIFSFDINQNLTLIDTIATNYEPSSVSWTLDGKYVTVVNYAANTLQLFSFYDLTSIIEVGGAATTGSNPQSVSWSPLSNFISVVNSTSNTLEIFSFDGSTTPTIAGSIATGNAPQSVIWSPVSNYVAVVNSTSNTLEIYSVSGLGIPTLAGSIATGTNPQSVSWDSSGNFVSVVNYNSNTLQIFSISGSGVPTLASSIATGTNPQSVSWSPVGNFIALVNNASQTLQIFYFDGISALSQIGSDVSLVYVGVSAYTVSWAPNGRFLVVCSGFPWIYSFDGNNTPVLVNSSYIAPTIFASWTSDGRFLADPIFYFSRLQMASFNGIDPQILVGSTDFNSIGAFVNLSWSPNSKFAAAVGSLDKLQVYTIQSSLMRNQEVTHINTQNKPTSLSICTTTTQIAVASQTQNSVEIFPFTNPDPLTQIGSDVVVSSSESYSVSWSPNGKFLVIGASSELVVYTFDGNNTPTQVGSTIYVWGGEVEWSPDSRFFAVGGFNCLRVFSFDGFSTPVQVGGTVYISDYPQQITWSPDGRYIALVNSGGAPSADDLQVFSFNGIDTPILVGGAVSTGNTPAALSWSTDGRFIAVVNAYSDTLQIFSFNGISAPTQIGSDAITNSGPTSVSWSPDGKFLAVACGSAALLQVFSFNGHNTPLKISDDIPTGVALTQVTWNYAGNLIATVNELSGTLQLFSFKNTSIPILIGNNTNLNGQAMGLAWSKDNNFIATINRNPNILKIFKVNYVPDRSTQSISNGVVFGNSELGSDYDTTLKLLAGANVNVDGLINYDCIN